MQRTLIKLPFKPVSPNQVVFRRTLKRDSKKIEGAQWIIETRGAYVQQMNTEMWKIPWDKRGSIVSEIIFQIPDLHNRQKSRQNI